MMDFAIVTAGWIFVWWLIIAVGLYLLLEFCLMLRPNPDVDEIGIHLAIFFEALLWPLFFVFMGVTGWIVLLRLDKNFDEPPRR